MQLTQAKRKPGQGMTAAEVMAGLEADPQWVRQRDAAEARREARVRKEREASEPIVADLRLAGFEVNSVWDLGNRGDPYPQALPILLSHLQRGGYPDSVMESLGSLLAVKQAAFAWDVLRDLYLRARGQARWRAWRQRWPHRPPATAWMT
jgi:hypothetical protein